MRGSRVQQTIEVTHGTLLALAVATRSGITVALILVGATQALPDKAGARPQATGAIAVAVCAAAASRVAVVLVVAEVEVAMPVEVVAVMEDDKQFPHSSF